MVHLQAGSRVMADQERATYAEACEDDRNRRLPEGYPSSLVDKRVSVHVM